MAYYMPWLSNGASAMKLGALALSDANGNFVFMDFFYV